MMTQITVRQDRSRRQQTVGHETAQGSLACWHATTHGNTDAVAAGKRQRQAAAPGSTPRPRRGLGEETTTYAHCRAKAPGLGEAQRDRMEERRLVRLWEECARGVESSWQGFVEAAHQPLLRAARRCVKRYLGAHRECDAQDFVHEVYCKLLDDDRRVMRRARFSADQQIGALLRTMLTRRVLDERRMQSRRDRLRRSALRAAATPTSEVRERRTPEVCVQARETLRHFVHDCDGLASQCRTPARNRRILRMAWLEGRDASEVSKQVDLSENAVHAVMFRARKELARRHGWQVTTFYGGP